MTPSQARSALSAVLARTALSATEKAGILAAADEYAAAAAETWARSPRSQGGTGKALVLAEPGSEPAA
jgi:hypothetical protein